jgi:GT2 family glycosyltransferase
MNSATDVSVVIVSFNTRDLTRECLESLYAEFARGVKGDVIVVDNASRDGSAAMIEREFPEVKLITSQVNLGFGNANNLGFPHCSGRYVVLLNTDAFIAPDALSRAVKHMEESPRAGLGGARLISRDATDQPSARSFPTPLLEFFTFSGLSAHYPGSRLFGRLDRTWSDPGKACQVDWVPGAFSIIRSEVLRQVGVFDPRYFLYYEEVDLSRRIRQAGWEIWYWPDVVVTHIGGESSKTITHLTMASGGAQLTLWRMRSQLLYYRRWHGAVMASWVKWQEVLWHRLRGWRNRVRDPAKREESETTIRLWQQAWADTAGGAVSPPQPW